MYLADCHVHSRMSPDGAASMTELAEQAVRAGLDEVCFTDHVEPERVCGGTTDWTALRAEFEAARRSAGDRVRLRLGMELGEAPWDLPAAERLVREGEALDFIIGSIHCLPPERGGGNLFTCAPADDAEAYRAIESYLAQVKALAAWGRFTVLGHLTVPLRYFARRGMTHLTFDPYEAEVRDILTLLVHNGCGLELNTNQGGIPEPGMKWLRLYRALGGELVTLGSDTHRPHTLGAGIREGQALLRACGFTRFCTFDRQRPVWHPL